MMHNPTAFPVPQHGIAGMTLRDYFAAQAMQGLLASNWLLESRIDLPASGELTLASDAYQMADAMLKVRKT
jgi:hypothetical protein